MTLDLCAGISVGDDGRALEWCGRLLGAPPSLVAGPTEAVRDLAAHRRAACSRDPRPHGLRTHRPTAPRPPGAVQQRTEEPA